MTHATAAAPFAEPGLLHPAPPAPAPGAGGAGALVISLDFELHWGVRDLAGPHGPWRARLLGAREAVPAMLDLFEEFDVAATWATVGLLFAASREEMQYHAPRRRPAYRNAALSPYDEPVGGGERDDPLHFAPTLVDAIRRRPRQEIATHTYSHYYCLEPGQDREAFRADLQSAVAIARRRGIELRSIVFPRNQYNPAYDDLLADAGIVCYRGNQRAWMYRASDGRGDTRLARGARLVDTYVRAAGHHAVRWCDVPRPSGLCDVPASFFLRPFSPALAALDLLRRRRIVRSLEHAAAAGEIVHLWWHPHNFGTHARENLAFLRSILTEFARLRDCRGMRSLTMFEAAALARRAPAAFAPAGTA
ncbi:MAG TPA: polysaccharide deacetylase family protein [Gemmatimonadaceae bacterium]|nr:polysaccharide deacetylase family protein [Gemmatimonadaceae bacterium]